MHLSCSQPVVSLRPRVTLAAILRAWVPVLVVGCGLFYFGQGQAHAAPSGAPRATLVSGHITADTTWTKAGNPYEVIGLLIVDPGVTLRIEPGVEVIVSQDTHFDVEGTLVAEGTEAERIRFRGSTQQSGWWYGIDVGYSSEQPASVSLNYVTVEHAGYGAGLEIGYASATIRNSVFQNNSDHGLSADLYGPLILENSTFTNNGLIPIRFESGPFDPQLSNLSATGSGTAGEGYNAVVYDGMHWQQGDHIFEVMGLPYVLINGFTVEKEGRLVISPGLEIQVENGFYVDGELVAVGTQAQPITITGINKQPGGWWGLGISGDFDAPAVAQLEWVTLEYGGAANSDTSSNLNVGSALVTVRNSIIRNGIRHGIYNSGGSPDEPTSLTVENTTISGNGGTAIVCDDESCNQTLTNITATGNGTDAMRQEGSLSGNVVWTVSGLPYLVEGNSGINTDSTMIIDPGVQILMAEGASFNVNGALYAVGTPEQPIIFTGTQQQPGWWDGIWAHGEALLELRYCDVGYGGASNQGLVQIATNSAFVSNCKIHHSADAGVRVFTNVAPVITRNLIESNVMGLVNDNGTANPLTVDARSNWWGDASGPAHSSNPGGLGNSVSDLVLFDPWLKSPEEANNANALSVQVAGVGRYSPGETIQYAIAYSNQTTEVVEDAVLRVALPANSEYIDSTGNAIFWPDRGQVFWKLGTLAPGAGGLLAVRVTYAWGLPDGIKTAIVAQLGGRGVDAALFDVNEYLAYNARVETGITELNADQVQALRGADAAMDAIYDQADAGGYRFGSASEISYNTGEKLTQVMLLRVIEEDVEAFVIWRQDVATVGVAIDKSNLTVYKPGRGLRYSLQTRLWEEVSPSEVVAAAAISWSQCMLNCIEEKLPGETVEQFIKAYAVGKKAVGCVKAASGDDDGVLECSKILEKAIPGYGIGVELGTCNADCDECERKGAGCEDDKCHCCTADKFSCSGDDWLYGTFGVDVIKRRECKDGAYLAEVVYKTCALCDKCVAGSGEPVCVNKNSLVAQVGGLNVSWVDFGLEPARDDLTLVSGASDQVCEECLRAKDPNEIRGPAGDLLPGQLVTYTIEYENVGAGPAFDVFIVNPLSEYFDLSTLTVQDTDLTFSLSKGSRRLYFQVGDLTPKGEAGSKGEVTYSVRLQTGLPSGTVIANQAVVHFPSVPEETPTNVAVNTIQPIAVPSQHVQVMAGQSVAITLVGQDVNGAPLTYAVVDAPLYGALTGNAPVLTYTPQPNFAGLDRLIFTANNGTSTSRQAEVVIEVLSAGGDGIAPTVKWTGPTNGAVINSSLRVAVHENGSLYAPYIQIQFSEPMAPGSINATTVEVKNGAGQVVPISVQYDPSLDQAVALMQEQGQANSTYTVTVKQGATDLAGTPLAAEHVWSFQFGNLAESQGELFMPMLAR
jgi:hypothetical protein